MYVDSALWWFSIPIFGIATILFVKYWLQRPSLPSGPYGLPVLGYLPFLGKEAYRTLHQLFKKYGPIMSLYLGKRLVIVLGNIDHVKNLLSEEAFLGRPPRPPNNLLRNAKSFSGSNGHVWREQKRFALHCLRDLGFGKTRLEIHIKDEIEYFLQEMRRYNGEPCDIRKYLQNSISNNTTALILGRRIPYDHPKRESVDKDLRFLVKFFRPTSVHAFFQWIRPFLSFFHIWNYHKLSIAADNLSAFLENEIAEHRRTLDKESIRDYIDEFLLKMEQDKLENRKSSFTTEMLKGNCLSLISAGVEPVLATTEWLIITMAFYPDVQSKVQEEIDAVVGRTRLPQWSDHYDLPYTMASLMELQRWKTVVPISMLRCTTERARYNDYYIPKGTFVMTSIWSIHRDERYWTSPSEYMPERFIDENGKLMTKHESFIPFSYGKRGCPGETLGKIETFLYFTNILHRFNVRLPEGSSKEFENELGIAQTVKDYRLCLVPRD